MSSFDLSRILSGWEAEPGKITVRRITGDDGNIKIQLRLDLGILQFETNGRPDGKRPHGFESLKDYHQHRLAALIKKTGSDDGFSLTADECEALREEASMYYHRYVSLFVLEEFDGVQRDTARNIEVLDLIRDYASDEDDRASLETFRPYLIMMNTRARANLQIREGALQKAYETFSSGIDAIALFAAEIENDEDEDNDADELLPEAEILEDLRRDIAKQLPTDPVDEVRARLEAAINEERYEDAAALRDELSRFGTDE